MSAVSDYNGDGKEPWQIVGEMEDAKAAPVSEANRVLLTKLEWRGDHLDIVFHTPKAGMRGLVQDALSESNIAVKPSDNPEMIVVALEDMRRRIPGFEVPAKPLRSEAVAVGNRHHVGYSERVSAPPAAEVNAWTIGWKYSEAEPNVAYTWVPGERDAQTVVLDLMGHEVPIINKSTTSGLISVDKAKLQHAFPQLDVQRSVRAR